MPRSRHLLDARAELGAAARRRFEAEFSSDIWARRLAALYCDVLK